MAAFNPTTASITSDVSFGLGLLASFGPKVDVVGIYATPGSSTSSGSGSSTSSGSGSSGKNILATLSNNTLVSSLLGKGSTTAGFGQMFANARPLKATVRETSKVMEHPVETGSMFSDFHIINPIEIDLPLLVVNKSAGGIASLFGAGSNSNYATTYAQIRQAFINATPLTIKTRTGSYQNMIISDMPHEEEPEMFNAIVILLRLRQVLLFKAGSTNLQNSYQPLNPNNSNTLASGLQQVAAIGTKLLTTGLSVMSYSALAKRL